MSKKKAFVIFLFLILSGCKTSQPEEVTIVSEEIDYEINENNLQEEEVKMEKVEALKFIKNPMMHNPVYTQEYSADPYAIEYDGRIYLYMTGDEPMYEADGSLKENNYSNINTIRVISSDDLVNWTDHGEVFAAGKDGAASWGGNSWAPAACWKMVDGKPKFFLYFANSGNGIAVVTSDSPTGPFEDPINGPLISRETPTCASVAWLFDPAVLLDDDGTGYIYFGGGIPSPDMVANPGTARVAKLSSDMIHLDGDPVPIKDVLYLFEDSGINKINGKYVYTYCSNFNVPSSGAEGFGFGNGEIIAMVSDNPMGPFTTVGSIFKNPEFFFTLGGNNHHCLFTFKDQWYLTYHARLIEESIGQASGYRSVDIDKISFNEDGWISPIRATKEGVEQVKNFDPYKLTSAVTMANQAGIDKVPADSDALNFGSGNYNLKITKTGAWTQISKADFGANGATKCKFTLKAASKGSISIRFNYMNSDDAARLFFEPSENFESLEVSFDKITDVHDFYFVFEGEDIEVKDWIFE